MKIIDTFPFFNELKMLDLRLNILNDYVDKFVLVEATRSHQDKEKPLYFEDNKHLFSKFLDKIEHVVVDNFPTHSYWSHENYQRDCILRGLQGGKCSGDDVVFISDLDEIWDPSKIIHTLPYMDANKIYKWKSKICYFYFNLVASPGDWIQPIYLKCSLLNNLLSQRLTISHDILRNQSGKLPAGINEVCPHEMAGWHFSYTESPTYKLQNFLHSEYSNLTEAYIRDCIKAKINPFHKNEMYTIPVEDFETYLPAYVYNNIHKYNDFLLQ